MLISWSTLELTPVCGDTSKLTDHSQIDARFDHGMPKDACTHLQAVLSII